jgi:hypothetical protein
VGLGNRSQRELVLIGVRFPNLNGLIYVDIYVIIRRYSATLTEHMWQLAKKKKKSLVCSRLLEFADTNYGGQTGAILGVDCVCVCVCDLEF